MENLHGRSLKWLRKIEVDEGVIYDNGGDWAVAFPKRADVDRLNRLIADARIICMDAFSSAHDRGEEVDWRDVVSRVYNTVMQEV